MRYIDSLIERRCNGQRLAWWQWTLLRAYFRFRRLRSRMADIPSSALESVIDSTSRIRDGNASLWDCNKHCLYFWIWRPFAELFGL